MAAVVQHFVTYYFPGSIVSNEQVKPVEQWDVLMAKRFAPDNRNCYGFRFTTRSRGEYDLDSKVTATSPMYFLNSTVESLEQVKARNLTADRTLLANMESNGYKNIVRTYSGWCLPLEDGDTVLY
jgi:hypothetical protein